MRDRSRMRWRTEAWSAGQNACSSFVSCLGARTCTWSCSGIFAAMKKRAITLLLKLPLLATNGVCYAEKRQRKILDVFTCIRNHRNLATAGRLLTRNSERHLKAPREMVDFFSDL